VPRISISPICPITGRKCEPFKPGPVLDPSHPAGLRPGPLVSVYWQAKQMTLPKSIAVAQTCPVRGDVETNLAQHLRLTALAASEGAQVVVFPELSLTGYEIGLAERLAFLNTICG
jgi:hypothetical protein